MLDARPRIFLRDDAGFGGLTVAKLRERAGHPEFVAAGARGRWGSQPLGRAILWMAEGRPEDLAAAAKAGLDRIDVCEDAGAWSDRGQELVKLTTLFDWLYKKLDGPTRGRVIVQALACSSSPVGEDRGEEKNAG